MKSLPLPGYQHREGEGEGEGEEEEPQRPFVTSQESSRAYPSHRWVINSIPSHRKKSERLV
jgi:hypothetical protein